MRIYPLAHSTALANAARGLVKNLTGRKGNLARSDAALVCVDLGDWYTAADNPAVPLPS